MTIKETMNRQYLNVTIVTHSEGKDMPVNFKYKKRHDKEKPMALDVLLQAQEAKLPDLAFRYGCRARNCGVCTCLLYTSPSPRDATLSRMPSSA